MEYQITNFSEKALHEIIAHIESRLAGINATCDGVYEKTLSHSYHQLLAHYGKKLFILQSRRFLLSKPTAIIAECEAK